MDTEINAICWHSKIGSCDKGLIRWYLIPPTGKKIRTPQVSTLYQDLSSQLQGETPWEITVSKHYPADSHYGCNRRISDQLTGEIPYQLADHIITGFLGISFSYSIKANDHKEKGMQFLDNYSWVLNYSLHSSFLSSLLTWASQCLS